MIIVSLFVYVVGETKICDVEDFVRGDSKKLDPFWGRICYTCVY